MSTVRRVSCSLIIATYNWPEALEKSIRSAFAQSILPNEIIIADDGSDDRTKNLVLALSAQTDIPLLHVWHENTGFRLAEIRNKAIACASSDYIVQTDGDIIMDKHFIADHLRMALPGAFLCGSRVMLQPSLSKHLLQPRQHRIKRNKLPLGFLLNSIRLPFLGNLMADRYKRKQLTALRGCNMSFWRQDLLEVNGYNTAITGWGSEDAELAIRLINHGIKKRFLKFMAIAYHLYHPENSRNNLENNRIILQHTIENHIIWTANGISNE